MHAQISHSAHTSATHPPLILARGDHRSKGLSLWMAFVIALGSLWRTRTRSFLAVLGIVIGVGSVVTMLGLGEGTKAQIEERIRRMGTNLVSVRVSEQRTGAVGIGADASEGLEIADIAAIEKNCPAVRRVAARQERSFQVKHGNKNVRCEVLGVSRSYFAIRNYHLDRGRELTVVDEQRRSRVALIGPTIVEKLFGRKDPLGETLLVRGQAFRVVGTLKPRGGNDADWDERVWIPLTTALDRVFGTRYIRSLDAEAVDEKSMDQALAQMDAVLRKRHRIPDDRPKPFEMRNQADMLEMATETNQFMTALLAGIAGVSLLVGGIGIMNIMLVSITERTREIGIRRALGARKKDVLVQFLIESLALCGIGAVLGIGAGVLGCWAGAALAGWPVTLSVTAITLSSACALAIGLFFGIYPAARAANLSPLQALRHE